MRAPTSAYTLPVTAAQAGVLLVQAYLADSINFADAVDGAHNGFVGWIGIAIADFHGRHLGCEFLAFRLHQGLDSIPDAKDANRSLAFQNL